MEVDGEGASPYNRGTMQWLQNLFATRPDLDGRHNRASAHHLGEKIVNTKTTSTTEQSVQVTTQANVAQPKVALSVERQRDILLSAIEAFVARNAGDEMLRTDPTFNDMTAAVTVVRTAKG